MPTSETREHFAQRLRRFGRVRRGLHNAALFYGVGGVALGVGIAALFLLCGWTANPLVNLVLAAAAAVVLLVLLVRFGRRWERRRSVLSEAFRLEALAGDLNSRVISAVDFVEWPQPTPLTAAVVREAQADLERPFEQLLDRRGRNRLRVRFVVLLVGFLLLGVTDRFGFVRLGRTVSLAAGDLREMLFPTRYELVPGPGRHIYRVGTAVTAGLRFTRFSYPQVTLRRTTAGQEGEERTVLPVTAARTATVTLQPAVEAEYRLRCEFGKRTTEETVLIFAAPPVLEDMETTLAYPLYTRLVPKKLEGVQERLTALPGTSISLGFTFSKALNWAVLIFDDEKKERVPLDVMGRFASTSFVHTTARRATLQVEDVHGLGLDVPHVLDFGLTVDAPPRITLLPQELRHKMPCLVEDFRSFTFSAKIEDDYGAARCVLKWRRASVEDENRILAQGEIDRAINPPRPVAVVAFENVMSDQPAAPGDLYTFQVVAYDNRDPKPQTNVSRMFSVFLHQRGLGDDLAEAGVDVMAQFIRRGGGVHAAGTPPAAPPGVRPLEALRTKEGYVSDVKSPRDTDVSRERALAGSDGADYHKAISKSPAAGGESSAADQPPPP